MNAEPRSTAPSRSSFRLIDARLLFVPESGRDVDSFGFATDGRTLAVGVVEQTLSIMRAESPGLPGAAAK